MDRVTIIIPVFNGSNYLSGAIQSALNQDYQNLEIIVVNDGSNDSFQTRKVALSFGNQIRYFEKENGGVATALNLGISQMSGEYFSWLSHDDLYLPNKISSQVNFLNRFGIDSKNKIVFSDFELIDDNGNVFGQSNLALQNISSFRIWLTGQSLLNGCTLLIPKDALTNAQCFRENLKHTQDYDLWYRIAENFDFEYLPQKLVQSRQHSEQDSKKLATHAEQEVNQMKLDFVRRLSLKDFNLIQGKFSFIRFSIGIFNQGFYYVALIFTLKFLKFRILKGVI
jgi:glycosyltransferase involved in cell wall biosynthesis